LFPYIENAPAVFIIELRHIGFGWKVEGISFNPAGPMKSAAEIDAFGADSYEPTSNMGAENFLPRGK
jgi:hypothetical protein